MYVEKVYDYGFLDFLSNTELWQTVYLVVVFIVQYVCLFMHHYSISPTHAKSVYLEQWQIEERESKRQKELEHYVSEKKILYAAGTCTGIETYVLIMNHNSGSY